jgi:predicted DCC family thiol-disulfide oxidoreductase YuxK
MPYQEAPTPPMSPELREACARAFHVLRADGRVLRGGRAALYVLERLGHPLWAGLLSLPPLVWGVELGYWLVARNRQLFSRLIFRRS